MAGYNQHYNFLRRENRSLSHRKGAAAIEAALIVPVLMFIGIGAIDIAQYINVSQKVVNASREGARVASRDRTVSTSEVESSIKSHLAKVYPRLTVDELDEACSVVILHGQQPTVVAGGDLTTIPSGDPVIVDVSFQFPAVRWLSGPEYWHGNVNRSETHSRRE